MPIPRGGRRIAALDACVLIPSGLRDLLLSCAHESAFRPVWQDEILDEVKRNSVRLLTDRSGLTEAAAIAATAHTLEQMARAFPDARQPSDAWLPLVPDLTCDDKDRHVLAVEGMSSRLHQPRRTAVELAEQMAKGQHVPGFGDELGKILTMKRTGGRPRE